MQYSDLNRKSIIEEHSCLPEAYPSSKDIYVKKETKILPNSSIEAGIGITDLP